MWINWYRQLKIQKRKISNVNGKENWAVVEKREVQNMLKRNKLRAASYEPTRTSITWQKNLNPTYRNSFEENILHFA